MSRRQGCLQLTQFSRFVLYGTDQNAIWFLKASENSRKLDKSGIDPLPRHLGDAKQTVHEVTKPSFMGMS
jgi:hypothetical protein